MQDEDLDTEQRNENSYSNQNGNPDEDLPQETTYDEDLPQETTYNEDLHEETTHEDDLYEETTYDEDLYEETTHRVVYRRSATNRYEFSRTEDAEGRQDFSRTEDAEERQDTSTNSNHFIRNSGRNYEKQDMSGRNLLDKSSRSWSGRHEAYDQRNPTGSRSFERNNTAYYAVAKWEVDYNNQNYIRSKLNKPGGFHRYSLGRPLDWEIEYDNMYYLRSFVNDPKGKHRRKQDIKRKRVPDKDPLADSTGWELAYGPAFNQQEGDVPYMPEERRVSRGAYRCYGVRRNASDCDRKIHEKQLDFREINEEELKYGPEFLQRDVQHILEQKDRDIKIGRGGYRHYDADRNVYDEKPADPQGIEYRESYATLGGMTETSEDEEDIPKGKPFKHTILKKIVTLGTPPPVENLRYSTQIKFIPGEGSQSFFEGESLRKKGSQTKKHLSSGAESRSFSMDNSSKTGMQVKKNLGSSVLKTKNDREQTRRNQKESEKVDYRKKQSSKGASIFEMRKQDNRGYSSTNRSGREHGHMDFSGEMTNEEVLKKFPPDIEERICIIRKKLSRPEVLSTEEKGSEKHHHSSGKSHKEGYQSITRSQGKHLPDYIDNHIDFRKHLEHPHDTGKSVKTGCERYFNENGSEIWVKTEESYAEIHHL